MKFTLLVLILGSLMNVATAGEKPVTVTWMPNLPEETPIKAEWEADGDQRILKVVNAVDNPVVVTIATIENPGIESEYYGIAGRVKYELEGPPGMLEMWNHFPAREGGQATAHYSRTMADHGLLARLGGKSDWREYRLPFMAEGTHSPPNKLVINLHFAGKGTVYLSPALLHEYANRAELLTAGGSWWPATWSGWIGGCAGALFGCFGGLLGLLSGKGVARGFVITSSYVMLVISVACLISGIVAVSMGQPYHVFYPLLLLGIILTTVMLGTRKQMQANYQAAEERRMAAMDTLGGTLAH